MTTCAKLFTKGQNFRLVQINSICKQKREGSSNIEILLTKCRHHGGREKMLGTSIFPFLTMFSKGFFPKVVIVW